ncbi:hypothetical protein BC830DRAFT_386998 [Chytriomyces sp. MP71]|nr:hypothetical protein BC830DRAFT_386998 [Chytriomyces sp. MP71]
MSNALAELIKPCLKEKKSMSADKDLAFIVTGHGATFRAHCSVLAARSPHFAAAVSSQPTLPSPSNPFTIQVPGAIPASSVSLFLRTLYSTNCDLDDQLSASQLLHIHALSQLCNVAELYQVALHRAESSLQNLTLVELKDFIKVLRTITPQIPLLAMLSATHTVLKNRVLISLIASSDVAFLSGSGVKPNSICVKSHERSVPQERSERTIATPLPRITRQVVADVSMRMKRGEGAWGSMHISGVQEETNVTVGSGRSATREVGTRDVDRKRGLGGLARDQNWNISMEREKRAFMNMALE